MVDVLPCLCLLRKPLQWLYYDFLFSYQWSSSPCLLWLWLKSFYRNHLTSWHSEQDEGIKQTEKISFIHFMHELRNMTMPMPRTMANNLLARIAHIDNLNYKFHETETDHTVMQKVTLHYISSCLNIHFDYLIRLLDWK